MKKKILLLSLLGIIMFSNTSCKKERNHKEAISQTVEVKLKANEAYTFTLPKNKRDDEYKITLPATHASISLLSVNANGERVYQYTPISNYVGADKVIVANNQEEKEHERPKHPKGILPKPHPKDCNGGEEDHYIITINFIVSSESSESTK